MAEANVTRKALATNQGFDAVRRLTIYRVPCGTSIAGVEVVMNVFNQLKSRRDGEAAKSPD